jgi:hypothetical protein
MDSAQVHGRQKHDRHSYGPFGFLNPTIRNEHFTQNLHADGGKPQGFDNQDGRTDSGTVKHESWAHEIRRQYRTRDDRKGIAQPFLSAKYIC